MLGPQLPNEFEALVASGCFNKEPKVKAVEQQLAQYTQCSHLIGVSSNHE
jgi:dTDP-4-amino-4,6-dideoxygalactose transaminase